MNKDINDYINKIEQWFIDRNLHNGNPHAQMLKLQEEGGELAGGIARGDLDIVADSIGDMVVVLVGLCTQLEIDIKECIALAYNEIKDRRGKVINGVFVKEEDLTLEHRE